MALADQFDGLLIDLDGVVWVGRDSVPGSIETIAKLLAVGKPLAFVTNNPTKQPSDYVDRLASLGAPGASEERVVTAGIVTARLAAEAAGANGTAFAIGAPAFHERLRMAGLTVLEGDAGREAEVVAVSGYRGLVYDDLLNANLALQNGAALVATSRDPTLPMPGGEWPGTGAVLAAIETASGKTATIGGKPERHLFEMALAALGNPASAAMIGDRISSDIDGGHAAGLATVLVLTGASTREEAEAAQQGPDHVVENLAALLE